MSEASQRRKVIQVLKALHAMPVENTVYAGTPDVNFAGGWIELKWLSKWPKGERTIIKMPHFTRQQRAWLSLRNEYRVEKTWLLLQCKRQWLLFHGPVAAEVVGKSTRHQLMVYALHVWHDGLGDGAKLIKLLTKNV